MNTLARHSFLYMMSGFVSRVREIGTARQPGALVLVLAAASAAIFAFPSFAYGSAELSSGGPYMISGRGVQRFQATLPTTSNRNRSTYLTIINGGGGRVGFTSALVILTNQLIQSYTNAEPSGMVLVDRDSFRLRNTVTKDVTGRLGQGSTLWIEGVGQRGAQLSWVLFAQAGPTLSALNPTETLSGRNITLHGNNFNPQASENTVTFGGIRATVVSATRTSLTVKPPDSVENGNAAITVSVNGESSNPINMAVRPMPILSSIYPAGGPPGEFLTVFGRGFARPLQANIVMVGPFQAQVIGATDNGGIRVIIPDWGTAYQGLPVSVISDGVQSRNSLIFYPNAHIFIEGSAF